MAREKNHLSADFVDKIRGILFEGQADKLTPAEFVLYLLETNKNPKTGLITKITRDAFSRKFGASSHYFAEVYHKEKAGNRLPVSVVTALANLTNTEPFTNPFFWEGTEYSIAQAKGVFIDMDKEIAPTTRVQHARRDGKGVTSSSTPTQAEKKFLDGLKSFAETLLIDQISGEWKQGTFLYDAQGNTTMKGRKFCSLTALGRPKEVLDRIFERDASNPLFAAKGNFMRALVEEGNKAGHSLNVHRTQSAINVQPHDKKERYL